MKQSDSRALDANMMSYWVGYGAAAGKAIEEPGRVAYLTPVPHPLFNGVIVSTVQDGLETFAKSVGAALAGAGRSGLWWLSPEAVAAGAADRLAAAGLGEAGAVPAMTVELGALPPSGSHPDVTIRRAESTADRALWGELAARGTGFSEAAARALGALEPLIPAERLERQVRLLAECEGKAVATAAPCAAQAAAVSASPAAERASRPSRIPGAASRNARAAPRPREAPEMTTCDRAAGRCGFRARSVNASFMASML